MLSHKDNLFDLHRKYADVLHVDDVVTHKRVWKATGAEIARRYLAQIKDGRSERTKPRRKTGSRAQNRIGG